MRWDLQRRNEPIWDQFHEALSTRDFTSKENIDGLVQERRNSNGVTSFLD